MYHVYPALAITALYITLPMGAADFIFNNSMRMLNLEDDQDFVVSDVVPKVDFLN